ncbi:Core-2/I-Branching enzyme [Friedmanniella luteola]|uniref:Peptide O-xylosyltransferase n=1 Tax=Friedmanniella luteola TaxID=546871 RepID=A0A1H1YE22_9ACTN|nr:beta-1,6-N-acetylglucosaminyltransferase [Friedmanniella luteola]SDT19605.1 Core-2/I-Branching enzyme [Friedmanniella luteola]
MSPESSTTAPRLACVVLAHADPRHVRRLVAALDPFPVFLHCDISAPEAVFAEMTSDLPARCRVLPRMRTGWARWENVAAELEGYRAALATEATHVAVLTGSDYPLASTDEIDALLARHPGRSFARYHPLPYDQWGRSGGMDRLRYRHWVRGKRMLRLPVPRRLPRGLTFAGGSQLKVLAREHAAAVLEVADRRADLVRFFRRSWIADESFVGTVLSTPSLVPGWDREHVASWLWYIGWDGSRRKSPPWLGREDWPALERHARSSEGGVHPVFARKFSSDQDTGVLDLIDRELRHAEPGEVS